VRYLLYFIISFTPFIMPENISAQPAKPCTSPECSQFDFWVGVWDLSYNDTERGTNSITKEMGGCVVHEHFRDPAKGYTGESWSVYNPNSKKWQQTWVDNEGAYIALTGVFEKGRMVLFTEPAIQPDGSNKQNRMTFYNISHDTFDWDWEATTDGGKTWKMDWHIHYRRR
jgi:hypothetical protein